MVGADCGREGCVEDEMNVWKDSGEVVGSVKGEADRADIADRGERPGGDCEESWGI